MATAKQVAPTALGMPTKRLFIDTLVRDIDLAASIVDLIDNSIDGAKRVRPKEKFAGLWVKITLTSDQFIVEDNCGGIDLETAKKYAFRFGRDDKYEGEVKHSVGHFGVGMKRTLFKVAEKFTVSSVTKLTKFQLVLDVKQWEKRKDWDFPLSHVVKSSKPNANVGTTIEVSLLRQEAADQFLLVNFVNEVRERIRRAHSQAIARGLRIEFNGVALTGADFCIKMSRQIKPFKLEGEMPVDGSKEKVRFRLLAGVDERDSDLAGWYVFCNDRLVLWADQSHITGWGEAPAQKFHQQFNHFRGYAYLDAKDAGLLPWNTTKTGMSEDSDVHLRLKGHMSDAIRSVTDFLNELRKEEVWRKENTIDETPLQDAVDEAESKSASDLELFTTCKEKFVWPSKAAKRPVGEKERRVSYKVPEQKLQQVMRALDVSRIEDAGLATFDFYYSAEIES